MRESYFFLLWCLPIPTYICTHNSFIEKFCSATSSPPLGFPYLKKKRKKNSVNFQWSTKDVGQIFSYLSQYLLPIYFVHSLRGLQCISYSFFIRVSLFEKKNILLRYGWFFLLSISWSFVLFGTTNGWFSHKSGRLFSAVWWWFRFW